MKISNADAGGGTFHELMQLQVEFQTRLAEETMRYVRRLQGVFEPHAPGTVLQPAGAALTASTVVGDTAELRLSVENCQRVHTTVTPALSPLVDATGTTWFPDATVTPAIQLLAPDTTTDITIDLPLPDELTPGTYRGMLVLQGFRAPDVPVVIEAVARD